ncbi:hypothetical protein NB640_07425 [Oxalobacter vibrioformis]|uniref:DUF3467 domain-containing protein n=1 Tax=Oxalobacter vibrioformis TaxID=933080 RepID=A0A9E9LX91_9BURK|nr:hypothetical protein [Oxalobacter vibrioformis]WAW09114.1 hypothetical protein NB640_07425 [Oxalobacter vibrioformis]
MKEVDLTEKIIRAHFDAPISVMFDQETGNLFIENDRRASPRIVIRAVFTPQAVQQLLSSLRQIEDALKMTEERIAETNFLDKTDIL